MATKINAPKTDGEKWASELDLREREFSLKEREQLTKEAELKLKKDDYNRSRWKNPLIVAIIAAALAAMGNALVAFVNGSLERELEDRKSEAARILEAIKTGDPEKAAVNLKFLIDTGLISNAETVAKVTNYLEERPPGDGAVLAASSASGTINDTGVTFQIAFRSLRKAIGVLLNLVEFNEELTDQQELMVKQVINAMRIEYNEIAAIDLPNSPYRPLTPKFAALEEELRLLRKQREQLATDVTTSARILRSLSSVLQLFN